MRVLVVDDEPVARRRLVRMLGRIDGAEVAGEAGDGVEALERIRELSPDAVLLDIRMPGMDGLTLAASADALPPIVFTTAYDEHAVEAFEVSAVDYLLKPIQRERLEAALGKVRARRDRFDADRLRGVLERLAGSEPTGEPAPVSARSGNTVRVFDPREIARFRASQKYTVFQVEGRDFLLDESLAALERRLAAVGFLRVHRAELVNLRRVTAVRSVDGGLELDLADGQCAPVSRRHAAELRRRLGIRPA